MRQAVEYDLELRHGLALSGSIRKEVADAHERRAGFGGSSNFAFQEVVERDFAMEHLIEIETIHADDAFAAAEGGDSVLGESAVAYEQAARPGRLLPDFAVKALR